MTLDELQAETRSLAADLAASADANPELDPNAAHERTAAKLLSEVVFDPPEHGRVRDYGDLVARAERLYRGAVAEADRARDVLSEAMASVDDAGSYLYTASHAALTYAHAANAAWAELTAVDA